MFRLLRYLSVLCGAVATASCDQPVPTLGPEADHCSRAVHRLIKGEVEQGGVPVVTDVQAWTVDDTRNVRVRFDYPANAENLEAGTIMCAYAYPYEVQKDPERFVKAQSIYFRGRYLSETELLLLNAGLRGLNPDYKIKR